MRPPCRPIPESPSGPGSGVPGSPKPQTTKTAIEQVPFGGCACRSVASGRSSAGLRIVCRQCRPFVHAGRPDVPMPAGTEAPGLLIVSACRAGRMGLQVGPAAGRSGFRPGAWPPVSRGSRVLPRPAGAHAWFSVPGRAPPSRRGAPECSPLAEVPRGSPSRGVAPRLAGLPSASGAVPGQVRRGRRPKRGGRYSRAGVPGGDQSSGGGY